MYNTTIDLSFIFYKSFYITKAFVKKDLDLTIEFDRGYFMRKIALDLCKIVRELNSDKVFIACDHFSFRKDLYPDYKNRGEKENGFVETQQELIQILIDKGINTIIIPKLEADDIMALIHYKLPRERHMIVTGDEDLRQLLDSQTYCYNADSKKKTFFYRDDSQLKYKPKEGIEYFYIKTDPEYVLFTKIVKGCGTDNVPPIAPKGFRTKRIDELYSEYSLKRTMEFVNEDLLFSILSKEFPLTEERFKLQLRLVCLQSDYMPNYSVDMFEKVFVNKTTEIKWEMQSILADTSYINPLFNS